MVVCHLWCQRGESLPECSLYSSADSLMREGALISMQHPCLMTDSTHGSTTAMMIFLLWFGMVLASHLAHNRSFPTQIFPGSPLYKYGQPDPQLPTTIHYCTKNARYKLALMQARCENPRTYLNWTSLCVVESEWGAKDIRDWGEECYKTWSEGRTRWLWAVEGAGTRLFWKGECHLMFWLKYIQSKDLLLYTTTAYHCFTAII